MTEFGEVDWWDSSRRNRDTVACIFCVGLAFLFVVLSPSGSVGLVIGVFVGAMNVYFSLHPDSRFYPGRLTGRTQRRGPEQHPRILYRILFFVAGAFVIWDSVRQFLHHRG
jgi:hypothetical protein